MLAVSLPVDTVPERAFAPLQSPDAEQEVALVEDQARTEEVPVGMLLGLADNDTVGSVVGGGEPVTVTCVEALALPPGPVQVKDHDPLAVNAPVDSVPERPRLPDQLPEATQDVAPFDDQLSVEEAPLATAAGSVASDTVGA